MNGGFRHTRRQGLIPDFEEPSEGEEKKLKRKKVAPTLMANISAIVDLAEDSELDDQFFKNAKPYIKFIAGKLGFTENQAVLIALFVEMSDDDHITARDICRFCNCKNVRAMDFMADVEGLVEKGYVHRSYAHAAPFEEGRGCEGYQLPNKVLDSIRKNEEVKPVVLTGLNSEQFFDFVAEYFETLQSEKLVEKINELVENNPQLPFCKFVMTQDFTNSDALLLYVFANQLINEDCRDIRERDWASYLNSNFERRNVRTRMHDNTHPLQQIGLVDGVSENGMFGETYRLTDEGVAELFPDFEICSKVQKVKDVLTFDSFTSKQLFYNERVQRQIEDLTSLLMPERFAEIQQRLSENGMRKGFACLFYGAPGTGKTETVNQLARITKRDVMVIDVSSIKDKFVGESEKNIKAAFDRYRRLVKKSKNAPILLFNEADAVLGIRQKGAERAVDKMENSIQNIILQEMENLDGIMIATTNLTENLDAAFERRFLYKIKFDKPELEAKRNIWKSMIPNLSDEVATELAESYDFSGGQIENIARKRTVELILRGEELSADKIKELCSQELIGDNKPARNRIGF